MKNDMKVIMESWRKKTLTEAPNPRMQTIGDFRKFVKIHRAKEAGKEGGKKGADALIGAVPVLGNVFAALKGAKDIKDVYKKIYGLDDDFKTNTGLDKLQVDDDVSKIIDDPIEVAFINDFLGQLADKDDEDPLPDVNDALQDFLKFRFNQHSVEAR
tara:strand:- start:1117 stop:1587 length:471 start_codon:yes stop_codon:yes gene_type:complete